MDFEFVDIDALPDELTEEQVHLIRKKMITRCILSGSDRKDFLELENRFVREGFTPEEAKQTMSKIKIALEELINSEPFLCEKLENNEKIANYFRKLIRIQKTNA